MSTDNETTVYFGDDPAATATGLLAAVERLGLDPSVVRSQSNSVFIVPDEVAEEHFAFLKGEGKEPAEPTKDLAAPKGEASDSDGKEPVKALSDLSKAELDQLAADEDIDLTGAKKSNATKIARIEEVRAERAKPVVTESSDSPSVEGTTTDEAPASENEE